MLTHEYDGRYEITQGRYYKIPPGFRHVVTSAPWLFEPTPERSMVLIRELGPSGQSTVDDLDGVRAFFDEPRWEMLNPEPPPSAIYWLRGTRWKFPERKDPNGLK